MRLTAAALRRTATGRRTADGRPTRRRRTARPYTAAPRRRGAVSRGRRLGGEPGPPGPAAASAGGAEAAAPTRRAGRRRRATGCRRPDAAPALNDADGPDRPRRRADPDAGSPFDPDRKAPTDPGVRLGVRRTDARPTRPEPEPEPVEETRSEHPLASYMLRVNGTDRPVTDAWLGESLLYVLRERLGLAGAKDGCEQGECGACSVQVDGRLVASCLVPAATAAGSEVRTVEGLTVDGRPSDVQRALADCGAVQCGFCIPGMAMTVHDLLEGNHRPTEPGDPAGAQRQPVPLLRLPRRARRRQRGRRRAGDRRRRGPGADDHVRVPPPGAHPAAPAAPGPPPPHRREASREHHRAAPGPSPTTARRGAARAARHRRLPAARRRARQGPGHLPVRRRPVGRGPAVGGRAALPAPARPDHLRSTPPPPLAMPGVRAVVTHEDVPGDAMHGRRVADRPVFADGPGPPPRRADRRRRRRPPRHRPAGRRRDPRRVRGAGTGHRPGEGVRRRAAAPRRQPDPAHPAALRRPGGASARSSSRACTGSAARTRRPIGAEAGLAVPRPDGGVELYVASTDPHADRDLAAACFGLEPDRVKVVVTGVPGAIGDREDSGFQLAARPARAADRLPGEVRRHPRGVLPRPRPPPPDPAALPPPRRRRGPAGQGRGADAARRGRLRRRLLRRAGRRGRLRRRPLRRPARLRRGLGGAHQQPAVRPRARRGRPPGLRRLRGPDGQARRQARAWTRPRSACATCWPPATCCPPARPSPAPRPSANCSRPCRDADLPPLPDGDDESSGCCPAAPAGAGEPGAVRRGVGYALGMVHVLGAEGADEVSTATVRVHDGRATVICAAVETGQGFATLARQIVQEVLGIEDVHVAARPTPTSRPPGPPRAAGTPGCPAGRSSAPRRWSAPSCSSRWPRKFGMSVELLSIADGKITSYDGVLSTTVAETLDGKELWATAQCRPHPTDRSTRPGRATPSSASPSARCARWWTSTSNSAPSGWWRWPSPRTSAGCSTRGSSRPVSRRASPRASAWR